MKLCQKDQTKTFNNGKNCQAVEYPIVDKDINAAVITLNGRYPETGWVSNEVCKEIVFIQTGSGQIVFDDNTVTLSAGDMILIEPNETYYWEGNMSMLASCTPAWYPEQHRHIPQA